jgi:hypothetical protein
VQGGTIVKRRSRSLLAASAALLVIGCGRLSDGDAEKLVRTYITRLTEAYRASDAEITAPVVSEREGTKLTGLIGVKRDGDLNLDAQLLEIRFDGFGHEGKEILVETHERWHYRDLKIGTGQQVGDESTDAYHLRYHLAREKDRWVVDQIEFLEPPQVGRSAAPIAVDPRVLHGLPPKESP